MELDGDGDSEHDVEANTFKISDRQRFINGRSALEKFARRNLRKVDTFDRVECFGNSYDKEACDYIAETIAARASERLWFVDFSNMFVTRQ